MSVYRGPVCKLCRREKKKLFLKGARCITAKCALEKRQYAPGMHGKMRSRVTEYGIQLREKQAVKRSVLMTEKQFKRFFNEAVRTEGPTGENLLVMLECRLDNIVRRMGFATSILQARQIVLHGGVMINGKVCDIPSCVVKEGQVISVKEKARKYEIIKKSLEESATYGLPEWLELDSAKLTGKILRKPSRDEVTLVGGDVKENLIVELYSK